MCTFESVRYVIHLNLFRVFQLDLYFSPLFPVDIILEEFAESVSVRSGNANKIKYDLELA